MRFELSVALKYLIPKRRQLSVSIISLVSILVISLVVWLVVLFLSVTEGIEKKWIEELVALNAPLRMTPKESYYRSYYYKIDALSANSNYCNKTIGEKLAAHLSNPYDADSDPEIPRDFPPPDMHADGSIKDLVKEGWEAILNAEGVRGLIPREYEIVFGNLKLNLIRNANPPLAAQDLKETVLNQISYITSFDSSNVKLSSMLALPDAEDYDNLLVSLEKEREELPSSFSERVSPFFEFLKIETLATSKEGWNLPRTLYPRQGVVRAVALKMPGGYGKFFVPPESNQEDLLFHKLATLGYEPIRGNLHFEEGKLLFETKEEEPLPLDPLSIITIPDGLELQAKIAEDTLKKARRLSDIRFEVSGTLQNIPLQGKVSYKGLHLKKVSAAETDSQSSPYWIYKSADSFSIPCRNFLGEGIVIPKSYKENGAKVGDPGTITFTRESTSSYQEMRLPIYVAGFYDPGLMPAGNRMILADSSITSAIRGDLVYNDGIAGNGIAIWLPKITEAPKAKIAIEKALEKEGLDKYWKVESFADYELTQPIFQQLQSDKTLFTLIAVIILIVACSNIISMLILLVNDKKKEVGILQSMGASKMRIGMIFGICGLVTGFLSSLIGTLGAILTLKNLESLVSLLNFLQGHEAFHQAFYGSTLPNTLSLNALSFVVVATIVISILAGIIPAIKAARIEPSQILRSE